MSDWILTRKDTNESITFDEDMQWIDELEWSATAQANPVRSLSGGLVIQKGTKQNGRKITLSGDWVWHKRGDLLTLRDWTDTQDLTMALTHYDGRIFNVIFRLHDSAMDVSPVAYMTPENDGDPYVATINLMTI